MSSSVIGWNFFETKNGIIQIKSIEYGHIVPPKCENEEIKSLVDLNKQIESIFKKYKRGKRDLTISIEEFPFFISKGSGFGSTARTITKLAIYTRITATKLYSMFEIEPIFYPVTTIRATIRKITGRKEVKKEDIPNSVEQIIITNSKKEWDFPYLINKNGKIKKESFDIGDSFAVSITHAYKINDLNKGD